MQFLDPKTFTADRAWGALDIARIEDATVRLHWTDQPYFWHVNDGAEVFVVVDGVVEMHVRNADGEQSRCLGPGDIFFASDGDEHRAVPLTESRILVIERAGSI